MAKFVGNITWQPLPGYPRLTGEINNERIEAKFTAAYDSISEYLPGYGASFYDERFPFLNTFSDLVLTSRSLSPLPGNKHCEVSLTYTEEDDDGDDEINYASVENDVPVEQHKNYKKRWNYDLHAKKGVTASPAWWLTAENDHTVPSDDAEKYKWVRNGEQPASGWYMIAAATKPGVESFKTFVPEVHYKKYSRAQSTLQRIASKDGTRQSPPDDYGRSGDWLQNGSSIRKEGRLYVLETTYLNSRVIDSDIYD